MVNLFSFEKCLKLSWIKFVIFFQSKPWLQLLHFNNGSLNHVLTVGGRCWFFPQNSLNLFWKKVFQYWDEFCCTQHVSSNEDIMSTSIWFNPCIATNNLYFSDWYKHSILVIGYIVNLEGNMFTLDEGKNISLR